MNRLFILPLLLSATLLAQEAAPPHDLSGLTPKEAALDHLLSERSSPEAFDLALKSARRQGVSEQALLEARFIFHVDRHEDAAIAALLPTFLQHDKSFRLEDSEIFATREDWLAVIEYVQAIAFLRKGDKDAFKKHITEAFWLSPRQGAAFAPHIERLRLAETMASITLDLKETFIPLDRGEPIPLASILGNNKALLLQFWSPWSAECEATLPDLAAIHAGVTPKNIALATIILETSPKSLHDTREIIKPLGPTPPGTWLVEQERDPLSPRLRVQTVPVFVLISPQGKILFHGGAYDPELWTELSKIEPTVKRPGFPTRPGE